MTVDICQIIVFCYLFILKIQYPVLDQLIQENQFHPSFARAPFKAEVFWLYMNFFTEIDTRENRA
jgi:hypothetical protein